LAKYTIALVKPLGSGSHREEVSRFHVDAEITCRLREDLGELVYMPVKRFPTNVARNFAADQLRQIKPDVVFMIDDDMWVQDGCFERMVDFLLNHQGPAVIGLPYCMGGVQENVCVFEWGSASNPTIDENNLIHSWTQDQTHLVVNVGREDAARRTGIERVANLGTGCIAYSGKCFDIIQPPWYDYTYNAKGTEVLETEECCFHRKLFFAGVPLYVDWDNWAQHHKSNWVGKPAIVTPEQLDNLHKHQRKIHSDLTSARKTKMSQAGIVSLLVPHCEACGSSHGEMEFKPYVDRAGHWTHFALCPATGTPLLRRNEASVPRDRTDRAPGAILQTQMENLRSGGELLDKIQKNVNGKTMTGKAVEMLVANHEFARRSTEVVPHASLEPQHNAFAPEVAALYAISVSGWMTHAELLWLAKRASELAPGGVWVEVGTWMGRSASAVALALPAGCKLICVDPFLGIGDNEKFDPAEAMKTWQTQSDELRRLRHDLTIESWLSTSLQAAARFAADSADVVFIDGDHAFESAQRDIDLWMINVKPGGILCGHDTYSEGVNKALTEGYASTWFQRKYGVLRHGPDSLWFVRRKQDLPEGVIDTMAVEDEKCPAMSFERTV
jgi:predicted O-methyltransferase YrrM